MTNISFTIGALFDRKGHSFVLSVDEFVNSPEFEKPTSNFVFSPKSTNSFSDQGEFMVWNMLRIMPMNFIYTSLLLDYTLLTNFANDIFQKKKQQTLFDKNVLSFEKLIDKQELDEESFLSFVGSQTKQGKRFFETEKSYGFLVPEISRKTHSPRISPEGNTFHGMKKSFQGDILSSSSEKMPEIIFIEIDMSAAHSKIARFLLHDSESQLDKSLKDPAFWERQMDLFEPIYTSFPEFYKVLKLCCF